MVEKVNSVVPVQNPVVAVEQAGVGEKKSNWWLWIVIAIVIIGAAAVMWWLVFG